MRSPSNAYLTRRCIRRHSAPNPNPNLDHKATLDAIDPARSTQDSETVTCIHTEVERVLVSGGVFLRVTAKGEGVVTASVEGLSLHHIGSVDIGTHHRLVAFQKQL